MVSFRVMEEREDVEEGEDAEHTEEETEWIRFIDGEFVHRLEHGIQRTETLRSSKDISIFRIPSELKRLHKKIFDPDLMVLGLFSELDSTSRSSPATQFKIEMASTFLKALNLQEEWSESITGSSRWDWERLQTCIVEHPLELLGYYDLHRPQLKSSDIISRVLTLDSVFLCTYLCMYLSPKNHSSTYRDFEGPFFYSFYDIVFGKSSSFHNRVVDDITKLENQIPLLLIERVLQVIYANSHNLVQEGMHTFCSNWILHHERSLPGIYTNDVYSGPIQFTRDKFQDCHHLLACLCRAMGSSRGGHVSHAIRLEPKNRNFVRLTKDLKSSTPRDFMRDNSWLPSACKMRECGIYFRGTGRALNLVPVFERGFLNLSATLHIPSFCVLPTTETLWRNIIAFLRESTDNSWVVGHESIDFIFFMKFLDELISSADDVSLLRDGPQGVIQKNLLETNQQVSDLINTLVHHGIPNIDFYEESTEWLKLRHTINRFLKQPRRIALLEWLRHTFGKPWLVVSLVAGFLILLLTFLQTLYTMLSYYDSNDSNDTKTMN